MKVHHYKKKISVLCPTCKGVGKLQRVVRFKVIERNKDEKRIIALAMRKEGATLAQIAKEIGVKSPSNVSYYLLERG